MIHNLHPRNANPPASNEELARLEATLGEPLPGQLRSLLMMANGAWIPDVAIPEESCPEVPGGGIGGEQLYGTAEIIETREFYSGRVSADLLAFGNDDFGNALCVGLDGPRRDKVYFWDHEDEKDIWTFRRLVSRWRNEEGNHLFLTASHSTLHPRLPSLMFSQKNMATPDPSKLIRVLCGEQVFGRDIDSKILQAANEVSARAVFEMFARCDTSVDDWAGAFADGLMEITTGDPSVLVGFDDGRCQGLESTGEEVPDDDSATVCDFYLRLEFTNEDASYYQFHLFPSLDEPFIRCASRKREGPFQHVMVTLAHPDDLQVFIQHLRANPHLKAVHDSNADAFNAAPSHSV